MLTKCPHCNIEMTHGSTKCPNCLGRVKYEYATGPSHGRAKSSKEKWMIALTIWLLSFGLFWWVGSWLGGANFKYCFWSSLVFTFYVLVVPQAKKDI